MSSPTDTPTQPGVATGFTPPRRVIARLDIKGPNVIRGMQFEGLRVVGPPEDLARRYWSDGIDELIFIDTVASLYGRNSILEVIERTAEEVFIPLTVGGGIRSTDDARAALRAGADKISVNSAAVRDPSLIERLVGEFGSQCVVLTIETRRLEHGRASVLIDNGREPTDLDAVAWATRACEHGAGELLVTSIDRDGMKQGFDLALMSAIADAVDVPIIASGGAGSIEDVVALFEIEGVDAVALGTILHFDAVSVSDVKRGLAGAGIKVRPR